jgi:hypothetical protein
VENTLSRKTPVFTVNLLFFVEKTSDSCQDAGEYDAIDPRGTRPFLAASC